MKDESKKELRIKVNTKIYEKWDKSNKLTAHPVELNKVLEEYMAKNSMY